MFILFKLQKLFLFEIVKALNPGIFYIRKNANIKKTGVVSSREMR
jgi:hypothetical protein